MRTLWSIIIVLLLAGASLARNALWYSEAGIWEDCISKSPHKSRAYNELGLHFLDRGDNERAYAVLAGSLKQDPYQGPIYINLGLALEALGHLEEAVRAYEAAIRLYSAEPAVYYNIGRIYYNDLKDRDRALGYFLKARDLDPSEPDVHHYLSLIYEELGDRAQATREREQHERLRHR